EKHLRCKDAIKASSPERKFQCTAHAEREICEVLRGTLDCFGNHGLAEIQTNSFPRRNDRRQQAKKVSRTAAHVEYLESGAESQRGKEFLGRRAGAFKKTSAGSIQKAYKEARVFSSIDLSPCVCEGSRRHQGLSQSILRDAR